MRSQFYSDFLFSSEYLYFGGFRIGEAWDISGERLKKRFYNEYWRILEECPEIAVYLKLQSHSSVLLDQCSKILLCHFSLKRIWTRKGQCSPPAWSQICMYVYTTQLGCHWGHLHYTYLGILTDLYLGNYMWDFPVSEFNFASHLHHVLPLFFLLKFSPLCFIAAGSWTSHALWN